MDNKIISHITKKNGKEKPEIIDNKDYISSKGVNCEKCFVSYSVDDDTDKQC